MSTIAEFLADLYGRQSLAEQTARYTALQDELGNRFSVEPAFFCSAPGRTELGGNHTDHNNGCVLAAAVHLDIVAAVAPCNEPVVTIHSADQPGIIRVDLDNLESDETEFGSSESLVRGVAATLARQGHALRGFTACLHSTLPMGVGLSSSAAFEVLVGRIFSTLANNGAISDLQLALAAKTAENTFFGKPCGFMDQLSVAMRGLLHIDFHTPHEPEVKAFETRFRDYGYTLCVVDTGGSHAELTPEYASIPQDMHSVAKYFGREKLRGLSMNDLLDAMPTLHMAVSNRAVLRATHFILENERATAQAAALEKADMQNFLHLVNESGQSSWQLLQNCQVFSTPNDQSIPLALTLTSQFLGNDGACRVHGGGFAGTIQAHIPSNRMAEYTRFMESVFGSGTVIVLRVRPQAANDTYVLRNLVQE